MRETLIEGHIDSLTCDTVYLYGVDRFYDRIDTLPVSEGRFRATLHPDTLAYARLLFADGSEWPLFFDRGDHVVVGGTAGQWPLTVGGNALNDELTRFYTFAADSLPTDSAVAERAAQYISTHPRSLLSVHLLLQHFAYAPEPDPERTRQLLTGLSGELKDRPCAELLLLSLEQVHKAATSKAALNIDLPDTDGVVFNRSKVRTKWLLLHFWASWDSLSRAYARSLRPIVRQEKDNEYFQVIGISLDTEPEAWHQAIEDDTLTWTQLREAAGWNGTAVEQFGIYTLPTSILLNNSGKPDARDLSNDSLRIRIDQFTADERDKAAKRKKTTKPAKSAKKKK